MFAAARFCLLLIFVAAGSLTVQAAEPTPVRIGILTAKHEGKGGDISGTAMKRIVQQAVADFGGSVAGRPVQVIEGDHQNRPKVGALIARHWLQHGKVDVILDVPNTSVQEAVQPVVRELHGLMIVNGVGFTPPKSCGTHIVVWTYDLMAMSNFAFAALKEEGFETLTLLNLEPPIGKDPPLNDIVKTVQFARFDALPPPDKRGHGGSKMKGLTKGTSYPLLPIDTQLLRAEESLLAVGGKPNTLRRFAPQLRSEIGLQKLPQMVCQACAGLLAEPDVLALAEKIYFVLPYDAAGAGLISFVTRYKTENNGQAPTMNQIGLYTATQAYLRTVNQLGKAQPAAAVGQALRATPQHDEIFGNSAITSAGIRRGTHYLYAYDTASGTLEEVAKQDVSAAAAGEGCIADAAGAPKR